MPTYHSLRWSLTRLGYVAIKNVQGMALVGATGRGSSLVLVGDAHVSVE